MCGIAGILDSQGALSRDDMAAQLAVMGVSLRHRGPDGGDAWIDARARVGLAHRRLSIIDLTSAGAQPMVSSCGRFVICYNGELYNHDGLRAALGAEGRRFRGASDTEVLLEAIAHWGIDAALARAEGMFAFALWDSVAGKLHLARDRVGIKPLYWGRAAGRIIFASEMKALTALSGPAREIDREALVLYLRLGYVPGRRSIWRDVSKVAPGEVLTFSADGTVERRAYWSLRDAALEGMARRGADRRSDAEAVDALHDLLRDAVASHMISDVPLGAFLSGGIDSTTVVALMQAISRQPIETFSIGFGEAGYDEAPHARAVATHLGTRHHEVYLSEKDALDVIPGLSRMYDEPFGDSSQIPTFLVSAMARRSVTVALSGDGGDELFAGYDRYAAGRRLARMVARVPPVLRRPVGALVRCLTGRDASVRAQAGRMTLLADALTGGDGALFRSLVSVWRRPEALVPGAREPNDIFGAASDADAFPDILDRMQFIDSTVYLPDDILTKVDRASMAVSLEVRVPLLDHRVVEFAWGLPPHMKWRGGEQKWLLRQVLARYVPKTLTDRPKMGFGVPIDSWLRGPLRDWAEGLLDAGRLRADGLLNPAPIRERWRRHLAGEQDGHYALWPVLMFQAWREDAS